MSGLRKHLEAARDAHRAARYPGDLSAELLTPRPSVVNVAAQGAVLVAAVAAVVLLVIRLANAPVETERPAPQPLAQVGRPPQEPLALVFPALDVPAAPGDLDSIAMPSFTAAVPSFPSWELPPTSPSTTKESI